MVSIRNTQIDPDNSLGTDYLSADAWEDDWGGVANSGDCVGEDELAQGTCICTGGSDDPWGKVAIDGWTSSDATRYPRLWTDPDDVYRHPGRWASGNYYRIGFVSGRYPQIEIKVEFSRVEGIAVKWRAQVDTRAGIHVRAGGVVVADCIVHGSADSTARGIQVGPFSSANDVRVINCNCYIFSGENAWAFHSSAISGGAKVLLYQCQAANGYNGFLTDTATTYIRNCIASVTGDSFNGSFTEATNNAYRTGSDPGTGGLDISDNTEAEIFTDPDNDDYTLLEDRNNPVLSKGTDLSDDPDWPVTTDFSGAERVTYSLGFDDLPVFSLYYPTMREALQNHICWWSLDAIRMKGTYHP